MSRSLWNWICSLFFGSKCAACGVVESRALCDTCFRVLELSRDQGTSVYLFEESPVADALVKDASSPELLADLIVLRLDQLGWEIGSCVSHGMDPVVQVVKRRLQPTGEGPTLAIGCEGVGCEGERVTLTLVESAQQRGAAHLAL